MAKQQADGPASGFDLAGQVALVTGASGGIGAACARALAQAGATVVGSDLRPAARGDAHGAPFVPCDITSQEQVASLFERVGREWGGPDILVHCAGVLEPIARTVDQSLEGWEHVWSVNARGAFLCCREAGRHMVPRRRGAVVVVGSVAGLVGIPGSNAYGPTKAAVTHMARNLACEWARLGIRVNCIAPGYVATDMSRALFDRAPAAQEAALRRVPMGRLGSAQEIAQAAVFLCSPWASFITGAVLPVDGGWSAFGGPDRGGA
ncbi:SDR family oxidoreductase [Ramlibacter sp. AN1015]|uniref:SDR family NAD(P)-dependent oxidoreductase n=1 Tax=Ramlibacter sp. AN1015 TaxID=3133428 RepID=UPI0030BD8116